MDVNSINSSISSLNSSVPQGQLERTGSAQQVNNKEEFLRLSINDYNQRRDELSASLQSFTEGIGISRTAQSGLEKQDELLSNIENKLTQLKDDENIGQDKNQIKNELNQDLLKFREEAFQTKYKNENLIYVDEYEEKTSIDISTKEAYYSLDKPNTPQIAAQAAQAISSNDFNNPEQLDATINTVQNSRQEVQGLQNQFKELEKSLETSARESIQTQVDLSKQQKANADINFAKEAKDFSKTNIQANVGYLAASQANIVQEQSVRLLS